VCPISFGADNHRSDDDYYVQVKHYDFQVKHHHHFSNKNYDYYHD